MRGASQADAFGSLQKAIVKERGVKKRCDSGAGGGSPLCCGVTRPRSSAGGLAAPQPLLLIQPKGPQVKNTDLASGGRRVFQTEQTPCTGVPAASSPSDCGVRSAASRCLGWRCWRRMHLVPMAKRFVGRSQRPQTPVGIREGASQGSLRSAI